MQVDANLEAVYMRTQRGQAMAMARNNAFPRAEMMLVLRLVNGYTPVEALQGLVGDRIPDAADLLRDLEARGLIERVGTPRTSNETASTRLELTHH